MKSQGMIIQLKAIEQYFPVVMSIFFTRWFYIIHSMNEIRKCIKPFKESNWTGLSYGALYLGCFLFLVTNPSETIKRNSWENFRLILSNYSRWREKHFRRLTRIINQSCIDERILRSLSDIGTTLAAVLILQSQKSTSRITPNEKR